MEWRRVALGKEIDIEQENLFFNYWKVGFFGKLFYLRITMKIFSETRMHGYTKLSFGDMRGKFQYRSSKKIVIGANIGSGYGKNRGKGYRINLWTKIKPIKQLNMEINAMQDKSPSHMQWVDILKMTSDTIRVYANSELITRDLTLRLDWTFFTKVNYAMLCSAFLCQYGL